MPNQRDEGWSRREFLSGLSLEGTAGFLSLHPRPVAAEPTPETTTLRLSGRRRRVALGYATLGKIGFEGRFDYAVIGTVTNLAARLCDEAKGNQILVSQRVYSAVEPIVEAEMVGELSLKGFSRPIVTYNIVGLKVAPLDQSKASPRG